MSSRCFQWHLDIASRMAGHSVYGVIPFITEFPAVRTINNTWQQTIDKVTAAICGKAVNAQYSGLCGFVNMAHTEGVPDTLGAVKTFLVTEVTILESPTYNRNAKVGFGANAGLYSDDAAEGLALYVHNWRDYGIADCARIQGIVTQHPGWLPEEVREKLLGKADIVESAFQIRALIDYGTQAKCFPPSIVVAAGSATLTAKTAGATQYYSLDGSYPTLAYSTPVTVTTGQTIRALSKLTDYQDSDVQSATA